MQFQNSLKILCLASTISALTNVYKWSFLSVFWNVCTLTVFTNTDPITVIDLSLQSEHDNIEIKPLSATFHGWFVQLQQQRRKVQDFNQVIIVQWKKNARKNQNLGFSRLIIPTTIWQVEIFKLSKFGIKRYHLFSCKFIGRQVDNHCTR